MGRLTISSGCPSFLLIDAIDAIDKESIRGRRVFHHDPIYLCMEALAQLGAMHVRVVNDFQKHAFLLKINHFQPPAVSTLCGTYILTGKCVSQTNRAFVYTLAAAGDSGERFSGEFMFALVDYDKNFKQEILTRHYRRLFSCLQTDSKIA